VPKQSPIVLSLLLQAELDRFHRPLDKLLGVVAEL
jgi:hypothetical protein